MEQDNCVKGKIVAIYCRIDGPKSEVSEELLEKQEKQLIRYAQSNQLYVIKNYYDLGYSGADIKRPGLQSLIADMEKNMFEYVLVKKRDRLFRGEVPLQFRCLPFKLLTVETAFAREK